MGVFVDDIDDVEETGDPEKDRRVFLGTEQASTSVTFTADANLNDIIHQVGGYKWSVNYYAQLVDSNDIEASPDINSPTSVQQYSLIKNLIIKVQTPIENSNYTTVTGEGVIDAGLVPVIGDCITATLIGGREAIFTVTAVEVKHYNVHDIYWVSYKLYKFTDQDPQLLNNMNLKVVKEYSYDPNYVYDFSAPIILSTDYTKKLNLKHKLREVLDHYFRHFINREKFLIAPPTEDILLADTLLSSFLLGSVNVDDHSDISKIQRLDVDLKSTVEYSIWDVIQKRNLNLLPRVTKAVGYKFIARNISDPVTRNIVYLRINFLANALAAGELPIVPRYKDISIPRSTSYVDPVGVKTDDDIYYVLSKAFYDQTPAGYGLLEKMLMDYLNEKYLSFEELSTLLEQYPSWSTRDQYYLIPILLVFIRDAITNTFKSI